MAAVICEQALFLTLNASNWRSWHFVIMGLCGREIQEHQRSSLTLRIVFSSLFLQVPLGLYMLTDTTFWRRR